MVARQAFVYVALHSLKQSVECLCRRQACVKRTTSGWSAILAKENRLEELSWCFNESISVNNFDCMTSFSASCSFSDPICSSNVSTDSNDSSTLLDTGLLGVRFSFPACRGMSTWTEATRRLLVALLQCATIDCTCCWPSSYDISSRGRGQQVVINASQRH